MKNKFTILRDKFIKENQHSLSLKDKEIIIHIINDLITLPSIVEDNINFQYNNEKLNLYIKIFEEIIKNQSFVKWILKINNKKSKRNILNIKQIENYYKLKINSNIK